MKSKIDQPINIYIYSGIDKYIEGVYRCYYPLWNDLFGTNYSEYTILKLISQIEKLEFSDFYDFYIYHIYKTISYLISYNKVCYFNTLHYIKPDSSQEDTERIFEGLNFLHSYLIAAQKFLLKEIPVESLDHSLAEILDVLLTLAISKE